jgi:hypothetical protein
LFLYGCVGGLFRQQPDVIGVKKNTLDYAGATGF